MLWYPIYFIDSVHTILLINKNRKCSLSPVSSNDMKQHYEQVDKVKVPV